MDENNNKNLDVPTTNVFLFLPSVAHSLLGFSFSSSQAEQIDGVIATGENLSHKGFTSNSSLRYSCSKLV